jgi:SagB-type dehydrogenase family enzyme
MREVMKVRLNPAVRIIPPSEVTGDKWLAESILKRRRYTISRQAAAAMVAAGRIWDLDELAEYLERIANNGDGDEGQDRWIGLVQKLIDSELILDEETIASDPEIAWLIKLREDWSRRGWHEAAEYHVLSFDYPCYDYSEGRTFLLDQDLMRAYQAQEPDDNRFKLDYAHNPEITLPEPSSDMATASARETWAGNRAPAVLDFERLKSIVSLGFGATGSIIPRTNAAPLLRRSSPSGGGRNPSEGYVAILNMPGTEPGWYHVTIQPFSLRRVSGISTERADLAKLFPETVERFPFEARALIVLTSVFERNMYRYREPRTFRTVHMDAGHIAATIRLTARSMGLVGGILVCDNATEIEAALGLDGMSEGYMLTVALADGTATET